MLRPPRKVTIPHPDATLVTIFLSQIFISPITSLMSTFPAIQIRRNGLVENKDKTLKRPRFIYKDIPLDHPVFRSPVCSVTKLIDFPLRLYRQDPYANQPGSDGNCLALWLLVDPQSGLCPMEFQLQGEMGSVIVVREDGGELTPLECEGICTYVSMVWRYVDEEKFCLGEGRISPEAFKEFYDGFLKGRESVTGEAVQYREARGARDLTSKDLFTEMSLRAEGDSELSTQLSDVYFRCTNN